MRRILSKEAEPVHKMRVSLRKLRTIFLFAEDYGDPFGGRLRRIPCEAARLLGAVRDVDVLVAGLASWDGSKSVKKWRKVLGAERKALWELAKHELSRGQFRKWLAEVEEWSGKSTKGPDMLEVVQKRSKALVEIPCVSVLDQHRFRIECKRLRYLLEFHPSRSLAMEAALPVLVLAQDAIGANRDCNLALSESERREKLFHLKAFHEFLLARNDEGSVDAVIEAARSTVAPILELRPDSSNLMDASRFPAVCDREGK